MAVNTALEIRQAAFGDEWYLRALVVRHAELRAPLGLCYTPEEIVLDAGHLHFIACDGQEVAATITLALDAGGMAQLRQVAVNARCQGRGVGGAIIRHVEEQARLLGSAQAFLNSREATVPFYEKMGYRRQGEPFSLLERPHQRMIKAL